MMEEEDTYHYDFTTASELEIFIARLEEIMLDWGVHQKPLEKPLEKDDFKTKEWSSRSEALSFSEAEFLLTRYYLKCDRVEEEQDDGDDSQEVEEVPPQAIQDMLSMENDFFPITNPLSKDSHPLARWYGLRDFLVLIPQHTSYVSSESRVKILLSSLSIAVNNTKCAIPFFMLALQPHQCYFLGVYQSGSFRTEFNMVHLERTPPQCKFLTDLLALFKSKISSGMQLNPVTVSVRFTYVLKDWTTSAYAQEPLVLNFMESDVLDVSKLARLPFGSIYDSISKLYLSALWPSLLDNAFVDGETYSDLKPLQAPVWRASIATVDNPSCLLTDYYSEFIVLTKGKQSIRELLGNLISSNSSRAESKSSEISSSLNALTESKISALSKAVIGGEKTGAKDSQEAEGPISSQQLMVILYYLFPDADWNSESPYAESLGGCLPNDAVSDKRTEDVEKKLSGMKSAPVDGLLWRLSIVLAHVIHSLGGVHSAAYLWYEFTQELRYRWENGVLIPGLQPALPDTRTCLLNQKLQLLNCCISRRMEREKRARAGQGEEGEEEESEEEFYDCGEDQDAREADEARHSPADKPVGRQARHGDLKLLETGEPLYVPVTQDVVPKTEDQVEEDAEVLLQLDTDARGKLMSASLLSDMEAFKAANPGCVLPDFIRWYSPRDWIEEEGGEPEDFGRRRGRLSKRMEIPGNTWLEVWRVARPVPAKWQRRLFDDTREAEKVLDFLERRTPKEFVELLLPVFVVCVIQKLLQESALEDLPGVGEILSKLIKKAEMLGRMPKIEGTRYEELINEISAVETMLVNAKSLKLKFASEGEEGKIRNSREETVEFIRSLLRGAETEVPGGPMSDIGCTIRHHFAVAAKAEDMDRLLFDTGSQPVNDRWNAASPFPAPHEKEMILRLATPKGPQRLHAVLKKNECRLCGAFTRNVYLQA